MAKDFYKRLMNLSGAVEDKDPHQFVVRSPSPSVNFIFGNGHGIPLGFTGVFFGPPKGGKSILGNLIGGQVHRDYPDSFVVKFDTEFRSSLQLQKKQMERVCGIDPQRLVTWEVNRPSEIFDRIENDLVAMVQDGMDLKLIIIDSVNGIQGRREEGADSIDKVQIGDLAQTLQAGFKRILPYQRRHNFAIMLTSQVRAEMDPIEQKRGGLVKMAASWALKHYAEYFVFLERNNSKEGREDLLENPLRDDSLKDVRLAQEGEGTGHKIRVTMKDSSCSPRGRQGQFTYDYHQGIINVHEEVFLLGLGRGIIEKPSNAIYAFGERKWNGKKAILEDLQRDPDLQNAIVKELRRRDDAGAWKADEDEG